MQSIEKFKTDAPEQWVKNHLKKLEELGYSIEKDGFELIEYMAYYMEDFEILI